MKRKRVERERVVAYFYLHDRFLFLFLFLFHLNFLLLKFLRVVLYYLCFKNQIKFFFKHGKPKTGYQKFSKSRKSGLKK
jgi:hypothetical protein